MAQLPYMGRLRRRPMGGARDDEEMTGGRDKRQTIAEAIIDCGEAEKMVMFRANEVVVNKELNWCAGGRLQMPGMDIKDGTCSILCPNMAIKIKMATLKTTLAYSNEQFLFHASVDNTIKDDGHFRYFAFDATYSANYVQEELWQQNASTKFMHVFRVKKEIPNLALFADSNTWQSMSGRAELLNNQTCPPDLTGVDPKAMETRAMKANALGMTPAEYNWSEYIGKFKTDTGVKLNGFISTTAFSATMPHFIVEPKFELMLKVDRLAEYLEHVKCYALEDYVGEVVYQQAPI